MRNLIFLSLKQRGNEKNLEEVLADVQAQLKELSLRVERLELVGNLAKQEDVGGRLLFDFRNIHKKDVYQAFLEIYRKKGVMSSDAELIRFLANHTNLGSESAIHTLFYRYREQTL